MINYQETKQAMEDMQYGQAQPNFVFALRIAAMSALQDLEVNGRMARILASYTGRPLPLNREVLYQQLQACGGKACVFSSHIKALYSIDELWLAGEIDEYAPLPAGRQAQIAERERLVRLIHGMSYKTVSFAMFLYNPFHCEVVAIDRHHMRRLGSPVKSLTKNTYRLLEEKLYAEYLCDEMGFSSFSVYAAHCWGIQRNGIDASAYPSHQLLSCRNY